MNREMRYVKKWFDANKLALNIEKTNFVWLHSAVKKIAEPITVRMQKITRANHVKFLSVVLDKTLSWKFHLIELSRSVSILLQIEAFCS